MAATTGFGLDSMAMMRLCRVGAANMAGVLNSLMSAPAENSPLRPVMTIADTAGSSTAVLMASVSSRRVAAPRLLTGGEPKRSTAIVPVRSTVT